MTLEEFKQTILKDLEGFEKEWEEGRQANPDHYPLELGEGDWFEQFLSFQIGGHP